MGLPELPDSASTEDLLALSLLTAGAIAAVTGSVALPGTGTPSYVDISAGQPTGYGGNARGTLDLVNQKLLVATEANSQRPGLFRCNFDGTSCTFTDLSAGLGLGAGSGVDPSIVIDTSNSKLLVLTDESNNGDLGLFRCNLDATGCTFTDLSALVGLGALTGMEPSAAIDPINNRLLIAIENSINIGRPALFDCALDGSACNQNDISAGQGTDSGNFPEIAVDTVNQKVLVVSQDVSNSGKPSLFRCELDGTACTHTDISAGQGTNSGRRPFPIIDTLNSKLLVFARNDSIASGLSMYRCEVDGTSCTHTDISTFSGGSGSLAQPHAVIDQVGNYVMVATRGPDSNRPHVFRCDLAFAACTMTDVSAGQGTNSGRTPTAMIDTTNSKLLVVTENGANNDLPALFIQ